MGVRRDRSWANLVLSNGSRARICARFRASGPHLPNRRTAENCAHDRSVVYPHGRERTVRSNRTEALPPRTQVWVGARLWRSTGKIRKTATTQTSNRQPPLSFLSFRLFLEEFCPFCRSKRLFFPVTDRRSKGASFPPRARTRRVTAATRPLVHAAAGVVLRTAVFSVLLYHQVFLCFQRARPR